jgi:hypothetical protein
MGKKQRRMEAEAEHAALIRRELAWIDAVNDYKPEVIFGAPMRCPSFGCTDFGLVESIARGRQHNRCWSCDTHWTLSTEALFRYGQAPVAPTIELVVGAGTLVADLDRADEPPTARERFVSMRGALPRDPPSVGYLPH